MVLIVTGIDIDRFYCNLISPHKRLVHIYIYTYIYIYIYIYIYLWQLKSGFERGLDTWANPDCCCSSSNKTQVSSSIFYIYEWRFPVMGEPPNHPVIFMKMTW